MLYLVLLVFALTGRCRGVSDNSSTSPMLLLPVPTSGGTSGAQVQSLRRQLMRDNYDYSGDEAQPNITAKSGGDTKNGTDHLPRASELSLANSNAFSAASGQQEHYRQHGQYEHRGQHEQGRQHDQPGNYEHRGQHEQGRHRKRPGEYEHRGQHEQGRHRKRPGEYEHRDQYEQPSEHKQRGQYRQPDELEQRGQYDQHDQYEQHGPHKQRGQRAHHGQHEGREQREQRGHKEQREHSAQEEQLGQFDEQESAQSIEQKPRAAPSLGSLGDTPVAPSVVVPFNDELTVRDIFEREHIPDRLDIEQDYNPSYNNNKLRNAYDPTNKLRNAYDPTNHAQIKRRPFSDLRGNYKKQYGQNDARNDMRAQEELASNAQESFDREYAPDEQEAFDQQDVSGSQDDEGSDFSVSRKQPKIHNEFVTRSTTRAERLYTPAPAERKAPPHRVNNSLSYHDYNAPLHRSRNAPLPQSNTQPPQRNEPPPHHNAPPPHRDAPPPHRDAPPPHRDAPPPHRDAPPPQRDAPPPHRDAPPPHRNAPDHNILKKDLLYYMDDSQLRRHNHDASPDVPDEDQPAEDQLPSPQPSPGPNNPASTRPSPGEHARRPAPSEGSSKGELPGTSRTRRSFVVTVSAGNVTYKLLTLKSRSGRRQDERRILEERGPAGVAIMSLDHAPLPAFRLPRARRQYMHAPRRHRRHEPA